MDPLTLLEDPVRFAKLCWPHVNLYDKQVEILYSLRDNDETIVPAGNALGKDFIAGFSCVWFFCSRTPCRIVTSSVDNAQLKGVLWGEIRQFIQSSQHPLPLHVNNLEIFQVIEGKVVPLSYLIGRVAAKGEGILGHHLPRPGGKAYTLWVCDEASGVEQQFYENADTWAHRKLIIGNPYPCNNFFKTGTKGGDLPRPNGKGYYRKIIKIRAIDSPNVRLAEQEIRDHKEPSGTTLIPGVKSYDTLLKHRALWDKVRQTVGLDAEFYEGAEVLLYPPDWLDRAEGLASNLQSNKTNRKAKALGVDPAEGGDKTAWTVVDEYGLLYQDAEHTEDTAKIGGKTMGLMRRFGLTPEQVLFDQGGGGKQHADYLRMRGYNVRTIAFGSPPTAELKQVNYTSLKNRIDQQETRYAYKNRRAEMYGLLSQLLDPSNNPQGWGIPAEYTELRRQLSPLPKLYDPEGRLYLPPKDKPPHSKTEVETIRDIIGCSPDEADSTVLAVYGLVHPMVKKVLRSAF